jgi:hypothetical protein
MKAVLIVIILIIPFILPFLLILTLGKRARKMKDENEQIYIDSDDMLFMH